MITTVFEATANDSAITASQGPTLQSCGAWLVCLSGLGLATIAAFRTVESVVRPAFEAAVLEAGPGLGPRRPIGGMGANAAIARVGAFLWPIELADGVVVRQEFDVHRDGLAGLRLRTVTWREKPAPHAIRWILQELSGTEAPTRSVVRSGTLDPTQADDWGFTEIRFDPIPATAGGRYALKIVAAEGRPATLLGLPIFETAEPHDPPVIRHRAGAAATGDQESKQPRAVPANGSLDVHLIHSADGG
jgi:hypothetical protein